MKRTVLALLMVVAVGLAFTATAYAQAAKPPGVVMLKASMGMVKFDHAAHSKKPGATCATCHHASKPEKAMKGEQENCIDCHTTVAAAPMKTKLQAAFHDAMAKKGICVDCHLKDATKKAPLKCNDCHKKGS